MSPYMRAYEAGVKLAQLEFFSKQAAPSKGGYPELKPMRLPDPKGNYAPPEGTAESKKKMLPREGEESKKQAQEKTALLTRLLKPISNSYKGNALIDRVAPLGWRRIGSEFGHFLGDAGTGAGVVAALGGGIDDMAYGALGSSVIGNQLNQIRANKYLNQALAGPNALSKSQLRNLRSEMGDLQTMFGADSLHELFGGMSARKRVDEAIKKKLL